MSPRQRNKQSHISHSSKHRDARELALVPTGGGGGAEVFTELQVHDACFALAGVDEFGLTVFGEVHGELEVIPAAALGDEVGGRG